MTLKIPPPPTLEEWDRFENAVESVDLGGFEAEGSEMSSNDLKFLLHFLREKRPVKVLEIGVSAGGTTKLLLRELSPTATLHSVDYLHTVYSDPTRQVGCVAAESYDAQKQAAWKTYFGQDVSQCIREIGGDIDFCILDTTHRLPGEILSYLTILPYLRDGAVLILHDIIHNFYCCRRASAIATVNSYCTPLLFSAIFSRAKFTYRRIISARCNIGAIVIDKALALAYVEQVFNFLFMPWEYVPGEDILHGTLDVMREHYPPEAADLFQEIVHHQNQLRRGVFRERIRGFLVGGAKVAFWGIGRRFRELMDEDLVVPPNLRLVDRRPGGFYGGKPIEDPEVIRREGIEMVVIVPAVYRTPDGRIPAEEIRRELENDFRVKTIVQLDDFFI